MLEFLLGRIHNGEKLHFDGDDGVGVGVGLFIYLKFAGVLDISGFYVYSHLLHIRIHLWIIYWIISGTCWLSASIT